MAAAGARPLGRCAAAASAEREAREAPAPSVAADALAGASVALVLVPQSLAYGALAGVPPQHGLWAAAASPVPAAALASSRYIQTGPVALTSLMTAAVLGSCGAGSCAGADPAAAATVLALVVGATRVAIGLLRGGRLVALIPRHVLDGFLLAAAVLIAASTVPLLAGCPGAAPAGLPPLELAAWVVTHPAAVDPQALAISAASIAAVRAGRRVHPLFPGALLAAAAGCAAAAAGLPVGPTVGAIPAGLPSIIDPLALPWDLLPGLLAGGVTIAVAGAAEAAAIGQRFAEEDGEEWDASQEFVSQGAANLASGLFGGIPVGGSFNRSALGRAAGARSRAAGAFAGLTVLLFLPVGASALGNLPQAVLGGLTLAGVLPLLQPAPSMDLAPLKARFDQNACDLSLGAPLRAWTTAAATLVFAPRIELGLALGLALVAAREATHAMQLLPARRR